MSTTSYQGILALSTILPAICLIVVSVRFHARLGQKSVLQFDDWAQIPALLLYIGMAICCLIGVAHKATGYPDPVGPPTEHAASTIISEKLVFAFQYLQISALTLIKCSALLFYRRIFCQTGRGLLDTIILLLLGTVVAWAIAFIIFYATACGTHPTAAWVGNLDFLMYCSSQTSKFERGFAVSDFILDTLVLVIPLPSIWGLTMSFGRRLGVTAIFMLALIGYGACLARLHSVVVLAESTYSQKSPDIQLVDTDANWYSMLETGFSLIAVNLPCIWSVIVKVSPESIIRLVRSVMTRSSSNSNTWFHDSSQSYKCNSASSSLEHHSDMGIVMPTYAADFRRTVERRQCRESSGCLTMPQSQRQRRRWEMDLESGIYVQHLVETMSSSELLELGCVMKDERPGFWQQQM